MLVRANSNFPWAALSVFWLKPCRVSMLDAPSRAARRRSSPRQTGCRSGARARAARAAGGRRRRGTCSQPPVWRGAPRAAGRGETRPSHGWARRAAENTNSREKERYVAVSAPMSAGCSAIDSLASSGSGSASLSCHAEEPRRLGHAWVTPRPRLPRSQLRGVPCRWRRGCRGSGQSRGRGACVPPPGRGAYAAGAVVTAANRGIASQSTAHDSYHFPAMAVA